MHSPRPKESPQDPATRILAPRILATRNPVPRIPHLFSHHRLHGLHRLILFKCTAHDRRNPRRNPQHASSHLAPLPRTLYPRTPQGFLTTDCTDFSNKFEVFQEYPNLQMEDKLQACDSQSLHGKRNVATRFLQFPLKNELWRRDSFNFF